MVAKAKRGRIVLATVVGLVLLLMALFGLQRMLLFPSGAVRPHEPDPASVKGRQTLWLQVDGGRVEAWLLPGEGVDADHPGPLVIFGHGNAEAIDQWPERMAHYRARGISVLLPEYRGYGRSGGTPTEDAITRDWVSFYDLVVARPEIDKERVILHGRSLGGGVVGALARERPAAAMILQSTFTSVSDLAWQKWFAPPFLVLDDFDTLEALEDFEGPVLVIHGRGDTLVPLSHAEALVAAARDGTAEYFEGGHNDTPPSYAELWTVVDTFLDAAGIVPR
ncbi:MAG: alpha/beta hydrolase [Myxococcota bacterium]